MCTEGNAVLARRRTDLALLGARYLAQTRAPVVGAQPLGFQDLSEQELIQ